MIRPSISGSQLTAEQVRRALILLDWLIGGRKKGSVTPTKRVSNNDICVAFKRKKGFDVTQPDVRAFVNFLRRLHHPIGAASGHGESGGYFYALNKQELQGTIDSMKGKIHSMVAAIEGLEACFNKPIGQPTLFEERTESNESERT